jgi:signal transduction histidine kinase
MPDSMTEGACGNDGLLAAMRRVGAGDLTTPAPRAEAGDDALAEGFDAMLAALRDTEDEHRRAALRLASASDARRRSAERDLHDGVQQHMALLGLKLSMLKRVIREDPDRAEAICAELSSDLQDALGELRTLAHFIFPAVLENEGLLPALELAADRGGIPTRVRLDPVRRYPLEVEAAIYFCCLEALANAAKHAGEAATATVTITEDGGDLVFDVADDGAGFRLADAEDRAGLQHVADRIDALGGHFVVESEPGTGTHLRGSVPTGRVANGASPT